MLHNAAGPQPKSGLSWLQVGRWFENFPSFHFSSFSLVSDPITLCTQRRAVSCFHDTLSPSTPATSPRNPNSRLSFPSRSVDGKKHVIKVPASMILRIPVFFGACAFVCFAAICESSNLESAHCQLILLSQLSHVGKGCSK
jgi:hypothetical protein